MLRSPGDGHFWQFDLKGKVFTPEAVESFVGITRLSQNHYEGDTCTESQPDHQCEWRTSTGPKDKWFWVKRGTASASYIEVKIFNFVQINHQSDVITPENHNFDQNGKT